MLSNHYPLVFATQYNWLIASLVFLMGVTIRHWFNTRHARKGSPTWTWALTAILFLIIAWLSTAPMRHAPEAVSYTHLDVYKRQIRAMRWRACAISCAPITPFCR